MIDGTDFLVDRADARVALAEVLEFAGRADDAAAATRDALGLYKAKGSTQQIGTALARLERITGH